MMFNSVGCAAYRDCKLTRVDRPKTGSSTDPLVKYQRYFTGRIAKYTCPLRVASQFFTLTSFTGTPGRPPSGTAEQAPCFNVYSRINCK